MTFILDMASGEEYCGEELNFPRVAVTAPGPADKALDPAQQVQLQLATVEIAPSLQQASVDLADMDIAKLIQSVDD